MTITKENINTLPKEVQNDILETLRVYDKTNVWFEYGRYIVTPHTCLKASYGEDHKFIGTAYQVDFYNEEERAEIIRELNNCQWY